MSGFQVEQPAFQEALKCYRIPVTGPHDHFVKIATADSLELHPQIDCSGLFQEFVHDFLTQANPFFSKSLPAPIFLQRLTHSWGRGDWTEEDLAFSGRARICWAPSCVDFYSHSYTLHWTLMDVEVLEEDTPPTPPVPAPEPVEPPVQAPPLEETAIPYTSARRDQDRMKQKVRRARLRAAIAQLRAEKMAENYYMRYGFQEEGGDSDSDLTYASETEPGKI